jgi:hypothetical protein
MDEPLSWNAWLKARVATRLHKPMAAIVPEEQAEEETRVHYTHWMAAVQQQRYAQILALDT